MSKTLAELCKKIPKLEYPLETKIQGKSDFSLGECMYLFHSQSLIEVFKGWNSETGIRIGRKGELSNKTKYKIVSKDDFDLEFNNRKNSCEYLMSIYNLDVGKNKKASSLLLKLIRPKKFIGLLSIKEKEIPIKIDNSKIKLRVCHEKLRFASSKNYELLELDSNVLGCFGYVRSNLENSHKYFWTAENVIFHFSNAIANVNISKIHQELNLSINQMKMLVNLKFEHYLNGKVSPLVIFNDLSYLNTNYDLIDLDLNPLIASLLSNISRGMASKPVYALFLYINFLAITRKIAIDLTLLDNPSKSNKELNPDDCHMVKSSDNKKFLKSMVDPFNLQGKTHKSIGYKSTFISAVKIINSVGKKLNHEYITSKKKGIIKDNLKLDSNFNFPLAKNSYLHTLLSSALESQILLQISSILKIESKENQLYEIFKLFYSFKCIGLTYNTFFLQKLLSSYYGSEVLLFLLDADLSGEGLDKIIESFTDDVNRYIKNEKDIYEVYDLLSRNFEFKDYSALNKLFDETVKIHERRIRKAKKIEELNIIKQSILKFDKLFNLRDVNSERLLKEKAKLLLK